MPFSIKGIFENNEFDVDKDDKVIITFDENTSKDKINEIAQQHNTTPTFLNKQAPYKVSFSSEGINHMLANPHNRPDSMGDNYGYQKLLQQKALSILSPLLLPKNIKIELSDKGLIIHLNTKDPSYSQDKISWALKHLFPLAKSPFEIKDNAIIFNPSQINELEQLFPDTAALFTEEATKTIATVFNSLQDNGANVGFIATFNNHQELMSFIQAAQIVRVNINISNLSDESTSINIINQDFTNLAAAISKDIDLITFHQNCIHHAMNNININNDLELMPNGTIRIPLQKNTTKNDFAIYLKNEYGLKSVAYENNNLYLSATDFIALTKLYEHPSLSNNKDLNDFCDKLKKKKLRLQESCCIRLRNSLFNEDKQIREQASLFVSVTKKNGVQYITIIFPSLDDAKVHDYVHALQQLFFDNKSNQNEKTLSLTENQFVQLFPELSFEKTVQDITQRSRQQNNTNNNTSPITPNPSTNKSTPVDSNNRLSRLFSSLKNSKPSSINQNNISGSKKSLSTSNPATSTPAKLNQNNQASKSSTKNNNSQVQDVNEKKSLSPPSSAAPSVANKNNNNVNKKNSSPNSNPNKPVSLDSDTVFSNFFDEEELFSPSTSKKPESQNSNKNLATNHSDFNEKELFSPLLKTTLAAAPEKNNNTNNNKSLKNSKSNSFSHTLDLNKLPSSPLNNAKPPVTEQNNNNAGNMAPFVNSSPDKPISLNSNKNNSSAIDFDDFFSSTLNTKVPATNQNKKLLRSHNNNLDLYPNSSDSLVNKAPSIDSSDRSIKDKENISLRDNNHKNTFTSSSLSNFTSSKVKHDVNLNSNNSTNQNNNSQQQHNRNISLNLTEENQSQTPLAIIEERKQIFDTWIQSNGYSDGDGRWGRYGNTHIKEVQIPNVGQFLYNAEKHNTRVQGDNCKPELYTVMLDALQRQNQLQDIVEIYAVNPIAEDIAKVFKAAIAKNLVPSVRSDCRLTQTEVLDKLREMDPDAITGYQRLVTAFLENENISQGSKNQLTATISRAPVAPPPPIVERADERVDERVDERADERVDERVDERADERAGERVDELVENQQRQPSILAC